MQFFNTNHTGIIRINDFKCFFFRSTARFKTEALRVMVNMLNESEIKNLKEAFKIIDSDNSGMISVKELQEVL